MKERLLFSLATANGTWCSAALTLEEQTSNSNGVTQPLKREVPKQTHLLTRCPLISWECCHNVYSVVFQRMSSPNGINTQLCHRVLFDVKTVAFFSLTISTFRCINRDRSSILTPCYVVLGILLFPILGEWKCSLLFSSILGGKWSLLGWPVWRYQPVCYPCQTCHNHAKRYPASTPHSWGACLNFTLVGLSFSKQNLLPVIGSNER